MAREYALLLLLAALAVSAAQLVLPSEIRNARLGCRYQLVCQIANLSSPLLWLRGGRRVTNTSDGMITVIEREVFSNGMSTRRAELHFSSLTAAQLGTYQCFERRNGQLNTYNGRIEAPADSLPINIVVAGAPVKNISLLRVGERSGVGCTVDSCLPSQYTVRFLSPSGVEVQNSITSTSMLMTFNWQAPVTSSLADGNYTCEVRWDQERIDRAVFQFAGTPMPGPTREPPPLPCPTPGRAGATPISTIICVASFFLAVWLR